MKSFWPWNCLMLQTMQSLSGMYRTVPIDILKDGESTSEGTGTWISTLFATLRDLNWDFAFIMYSTRDWEEPLLTTASTHIRGFTWVFKRYDMSSNSPSGGIKEIVRSFSNRARRTHWWNLMSSISTDLTFATGR